MEMQCGAFFALFSLSALSGQVTIEFLVQSTVTHPDGSTTTNKDREKTTNGVTNETTTNHGPHPKTARKDGGDLREEGQRLGEAVDRGVIVAVADHAPCERAASGLS